MATSRRFELAKLIGAQSQPKYEDFHPSVPLSVRTKSRSHDAPHHDRPGRIRREEVGEMVHREARVRDPRSPRPLDHRRTEEGEHRVAPMRSPPYLGTGELRDLLRREGRQDGGSGTEEGW